MTRNLARKQADPAIVIIVAVALFLPGCSPKPAQAVALNGKTASHAIAIAQTQVARYTKVPDCRSGGPRWRYGVRAEADFIVVKLGPKNPKGPSFRVTMRGSDLGVVGTDRLS